MADAVGLTARFAAKPLEQPKYSIRDVPKCSKDLSGSILQEITDRDCFNKSMAEMVLLCNEVTRRRDSTTPVRKSQKVKRTTKPLSLEYMADRLDVDDPLFGFIVRTKRLMPNSNLSQEQQLKFQEGMMQGFITVTTFTNWQKTFRWDSMHDSAFSYDEPKLAEQMASRERKADYDGSLSAEMQNAVRCGDIWNEGIVFPHIAEISLLGALGCGRTLVSLAIERLEGMNSTGIHNYEFVALQATKNSVQFYETMGFVRVGAITADENFEKKQKQKAKERENSSDTETDGSDSEKESMDSNSIESDKSVFVSKPTTIVTTTKMGQTPMDLAKQYHVDVWDIIFLNRFTYPSIEPRSWLKKGIELSCPDPTKFDGISNSSHNDKSSKKSSATQWYFARNNETPKQIAERIQVPCQHLIAANRERFQDLAPNSRLMPRTRIQVSNLTTHHDKHIPYCHWTFPDDEFESNEPSYMMARKLNRRKGRAMKQKPFESSLCAPITKHIPKKDKSSQPVVRTPLHNSLKSVASSQPPPQMMHKSMKPYLKHPDEPIPPKKPKTAYQFFLEEEKTKLKPKNKGSTIEFTMKSASKWKGLSDRDKRKYEEKIIGKSRKYQDALKKYEQELDKFRINHPELADVDDMKEVSKPMEYFDKVVTLNGDGQKEAGGEFKYYYVLTFIPDLFWCHLAPLRSCGCFGPSRPDAEGRPMWVLVDENEGKEVDISASVCEIVESIATTKCQDADDERWDIRDSGHSVAGDVSDTHNQRIKVDINHGHATSVPSNKYNEPRRKRDPDTGPSSICRSRIEKTERAEESVKMRKTSRKMISKETISREGKRKRGQPQKISSQETATVLSSTNPPKIDDMEGAKRKRDIPKKMKRTAELDFKATKDRKCKMEATQDYSIESLACASLLPDTYKKVANAPPTTGTTVKETRSKSEGSKNSAILDSLQPPTIGDPNRGLDGKKSKLESRKESVVSLNTSPDYTDKVVTLNSDGQREAGVEYKYYYVLTFIPYHFRCRLVPMISCGFFDSSQPQYQGRPMWALVDENENEGKDLDIKANFCDIVESTATLKCTDADDERWDIHKSGRDALSKFYTLAYSQGIKADINHGCATYANTDSKLKLKRSVRPGDRSAEEPLHQSSISTDLDSKVTYDQEYMRKSAEDSDEESLIPLTRPYDMFEKGSNAPLTLDRTIEKGSKNSPMSNPAKDNPNCTDRGLDDWKRKLESARKNKGSTTPITPSGSHGGIQEKALSKSTLSPSDNSMWSPDVKKGRCSNSSCAPMDLSQVSRGAEEGSRMIICPSLNRPLSLDKKVEHQCTRKEEHLEQIEEMVSLNNRTLCISEDSNQTFSDVSCETNVKEREMKEPSKNRQLIEICKSPTSLVSHTPTRVKQKSITSFFKSIL